ncbi:O-antigen ligase family protein [Candidatus Calescamantes bacterium]|nr:O-antigen ligase family protein [Candidatus Calescamantes bacterium]
MKEQGENVQEIGYQKVQKHIISGQLAMWLTPVLLIISLLFYGCADPFGKYFLMVTAILWAVFSLYCANRKKKLFFTGHIKLFVFFSSLLLIYLLILTIRFAPVKGESLESLFFYAILLFLSFTLIQQQLDIFFISSVIYLLALLQLVIGFTQMIFGNSPTGTFFSPNLFADMLILGLFSGITILKTVKKKWKIAVFISFLLFFMMVLFTGSRGAYLALVGVFLLMAVKWKKIVLAVMLVIFSAAVILLLNNPIQDKLFSEKEKTPFIWDRLNIWRSSLDLIKETPAFGVGLAQYKYRVQKYRYPTEYYMAKYPKRVSHPHNLFLYMMTSTGIFGTLLILTLPLLLLFYYKPGPEGYGLLALLIHSMVNDSLVTPGLLLPAIFLFTAGLKINTRFKEPFRIKTGNWIILNTVLLLIVVFLGLFRFENILAMTPSKYFENIKNAGRNPAASFNVLKTVTRSHQLEYLEAQRFGHLFNATRNEKYLTEYAASLEESLRLNPYFKKARLEYLRFVSQFLKDPGYNAIFETNLEEAKILDPYDVYFLEFTADLFTSLSDKHRAIEYLKTAVELEPNFAVAWYKLGLLENNPKLIQKAKQINAEFFPAFSYVYDGRPVHLYEYRLLDLKRVREESHEKD